MGFKYNPLVLSGFDLSGGGSSGPTAYAGYKSPAASAALLPTTGNDDGDVRVALDTSHVYVWSATDSTWHDVGLAEASGAGVTPNDAGYNIQVSAVAPITEHVLILQPADDTHPGIVSISDQSYAGSKTFVDGLYTNTIDAPETGGTDTIAIGTQNAEIINIGNPGATINIQGDTIYQNVTELQVADKNIVVNKNGSVGSGSSAGLQIEEGGVVAAYTTTSADRASWEFKAPATAGVATVVPGASGITLNQSSHNPVTIGTANGLSLSTQQLSLQTASISVPGALSAVDFANFNQKVDPTRAVNTSAPLTGGGDLSTDRTISIPPATNSVDGYLTAVDHTTFVAKVAPTRAINTSAPLSGGGDLSADRTLSITQASGSVDGYLSASNFTIFNNKQPAGNYPIASAGDLNEASFTASDNQGSPANVTGFVFSNAVTRGFSSTITVTRGSTYGVYRMDAVQRGSDWSFSLELAGDETGLMFSITNAGQIQYTTNSTGNTALIKYRAVSLGI